MAVGTINLLDSDTINKIAAGEVVERPASVVKELVENAIDAKATAITVEIADGGIGMIRVTDNGSGILKEDIEPAFKRHATSKIGSVMDLLSIGSLGFRGEALSSIAAVSQVEMITKTRREITGWRFLCDGGETRSLEAIGCPEGTTIIVRQLFYNTPVRRKFLKTAQTEAGYVIDLINKLAMSHPEISFKLVSSHQNRLHTSGNTNLKDIIYQVYGRDVTMQLMPIRAESDLMTITGFLGKPSLSRGTRAWENYFINGRYIKSAIITSAIEDAYKTFVMIHKYPFTALHISIDPAYIDVNVHPRKMDIRFSRNEEVYQYVFSSLRNVLEGRDLIPETTLTEEKKDDSLAKAAIPEPFEKHRISHEAASGTSFLHDAGSAYLQENSSIKNNAGHMENTGSTEESGSNFDNNGKGFERQPGQAVINQAASEKSEPLPRLSQVKQETLEDDRFLGKAARPKHRLIGQVFATYWLIEYENKLFIIDQHAAHEKVLYERFSKAFNEQQLHCQQLSPPAVVNLTPAEEDMFRMYTDYFRELCFEVEPFGGNAYAIYGVPLQLFGMDAGDIFIEILDSLTPEKKSTEGSAITYHIATMACKAAVKGNQTLSYQEADALISEMLEADNPYSCPHGRPTVISISKYEMEKKFGRIQS